VGAAGGVPEVWAVLVPAAVLAGAGLAIANARVDVERDEAAGVRSVATWLGVERAWTVQTVLLGLVVVAAITSLLLAAVPVPALVGGAVAVIGLGVGIVLGRSAEVVTRERAWRIQAIAIGGLAAVWLAGIRAAGLA
jgi:4-hydroxybenzoate polyprenyltransferase